MSRFDVPKGDLVKRVAVSLQKLQDIKPPVWASFVKTGAHKERPPVQKDWWFVRSAAVLRRVAESDGPIGVSKLRKLYGGKKNRGMAPERFKPGSGNVVRKVLQQLEKSKLVKQTVVGVHKGRVVTPSGRKLLDSAAKELMQEFKMVIPKAVPRPVEPVEVKPAPKKRAVPRKKKAEAKPVEEVKPEEKKIEGQQ